MLFVECRCSGGVAGVQGSLPMFGAPIYDSARSTFVRGPNDAKGGTHWHEYMSKDGKRYRSEVAAKGAGFEP